MTLKVLVAPLDWGLGHATRCIPLIRTLLTKGANVVLAGEGACEALLRTEFPLLKFLSLPGYRVEYGRSKIEMIGKMLWQIPKILESMDEEKEWLADVMKMEKFDVIISDNRYGLIHPDAYSIFVGHQLLIKTNLGEMVDALIQPFQLDWINKFDECWIPDLEGEINLAGDLSHPETLPRIPVTYIGPLSRMQQMTGNAGDLLVVMSGPEPQRSILEQKLLTELQAYARPVVFVRGLPGETELPEVPSHIRIVNHLNAAELNEAMVAAPLVIGRCGYSTIMDLVTLQKKSILIPTPGQTEQEYLSTHLMEQGVALCFDQENFELLPALSLATEFNYYFPALPANDTLDELISALPSKLLKADVEKQREF